MDWVTFAIYAVMFFGAFAVLGEVVALGAAIGLGYQAVQWVQTGKWPSYTLGSQLDVPTDFAPTHWVIVDRLIHYVLFDVETAFVVLICVALMSPIKERLERVPSPAKPPAKSSGVPVVPPNAPAGAAPAPRPSPKASTPLPGPELGMLGRLGVFLGWLFTAVALVCAAPAVMIWINGGEPVLGWALLLAAGAVWLFGRGIRYVLVGPAVAPAPAERS
ncbi:hypothetical protein [Bradyrhizobium sp. CCGB20]|uniref:hypothetical protein n=1 Tax=Bradyrhizobium sp. CCGB20 TaxID=2949633 RepID=UPI0020B2E5D9|nr:hypothetical protein [Bradyrhizobium sp. CCGB20]MCP3395754.1 hypothetical protein [Bradyrhizobium sp. CCGB20]